MTTECIASKLEFQGLEGRRVEAEFNGGQITQTPEGCCYGRWRTAMGSFAAWPPALGTGGILASPSSVWRIWWGSGFMDWPWAMRISTMHEELRTDPLMAVLVGKEDPLGRDRRAEADRGKRVPARAHSIVWSCPR